MIWSLISNWLKLSIAAVLAAFLFLGARYTYGTLKEVQRATLAAAEATAKAIERRVDIDDKIINMDAVALCKQLGGGVQCDDLKLRRVEANRR